MMNWWWTDDELMMNRWWTADEQMMNSWSGLVCQRLPQTTTDCHWLIGSTPLNTQSYLRGWDISLTPPTTRAPLAVLKIPCSYQYTLYIIQNIKLWADLCSKVSNKICTKNVRMGLNLNESWFTKSCLNTNRPTGNGFLCAGPWRALDNRTSEYTIHCQQPSGENMTRFNHIHTWTWVLQPS